MIWFPLVAGKSRHARHHSKWRHQCVVSLTAHVMGAMISDVFYPAMCICAAWGYSKKPSSCKSSRVVGGRGREVGDPCPQVSSLKFGVEMSQIVLSLVWCSKATANDRRHLALCHDEFPGHRSGLCRSGGISNNNNRDIVKSV
ncbi:hypothetical protein TNCV_2831531 [Trichonephila clavipes]|nr:hypothetical protein TNCV_2831531 [Trichonephila clavipes]